MHPQNPRTLERSAVSEFHSVPRDNTAAVEDVYKSYLQLVRGICLRMLRNPTEADDVVQDVFVRVLLKLHTFRGESALSSWLYRLTTNLVLMRFRKTSREPAPLEALLADDGESNSDIGTPDLHLNGAVDRVDLQAAIDLLPQGPRTVFVLHDIQGYEHKEIAALLGYSIGNSKSQLHRARLRLRKLLRGRPGIAVLRDVNRGTC